MRKSRSTIRLAAFAALVIAAGLATPTARGGWSIFYVTDSTGAKIAEVAEQIFSTGNPTLGYDYEFRVANITPSRVPIYGFQLYTGDQTGLAPHGLFPIGPVPGYVGYSLDFGAIPNATSTFLVGEGQTFTPIPWGFTEFLNAGPTGYRLTWATSFLPLPYHYFTQFDLFSPNPPVSGGGAVDPFTGPGGLGVDLTGNGTFDNTDFTAPVPISSSQDTSDPYGGSFTSYATLPEPGSLVLLAIGAAAIGGAGWRGWQRSRAGVVTG